MPCSWHPLPSYSGTTWAAPLRLSLWCGIECLGFPCSSLLCLSCVCLQMEDWVWLSRYFSIARGNRKKSKVRETLVEAARAFGKNPGHSTRHASRPDSFGSPIQKTTHRDSPSCSMAYEDSQANHPDLNFLKLKIIHEKF